MLNHQCLIFVFSNTHAHTLTQVLEWFHIALLTFCVKMTAWEIFQNWNFIFKQLKFHSFAECTILPCIFSSSFIFWWTCAFLSFISRCSKCKQILCSSSTSTISYQHWIASRSATNIKGFTISFFVFFLSFFVFISWKWLFTFCLHRYHSKYSFFHFFFVPWNFAHDSCHNPIRLSSRRKGLNSYYYDYKCTFVWV